MDFQKQGFPLLDMGIGLNTGDMSVGNMGSSTLQNYTVLGDSVNLAARLEGLNKDYGTQIIIGSETYQEISVDVEKWLNEYNNARELYKNKKFIHAAQAYQNCTNLNSKDKTSQIFLIRCEEFIKNPPDESWDGTYNLDHK